jgi:hypothetical protein
MDVYTRRLIYKPSLLAYAAAGCYEDVADRGIT